MALLSIDEFHEIIEQEVPWVHEQGLILEAVGDGRARMRLPYDARAVRPGGSITGPHMMMLADVCMYAVVLGMIGPQKMAVTTSFNVNFLRRPMGCDLVAEGRIIKLGRRLAVVEVSVLAGDDGDVAAHATGTYSIPPKG